MYERWAGIYVGIYLNQEKGPDAAREWAYKLGLTKQQVKDLSPYIRNSFKKLGLTPTT